METKELFTRVNIGKMRLKNRIIMCPMGNKTDPDGGVQERNIDYFVERAKGGCAAIFTGAFMCTEEFETRGCNVIYNFSHVDRLMLTDPYWPNKVKAGQYEDIVPCIGCNECMFTSRNGQYRHCAVNPLCYHEKDYPLIPAEEPKKVLVIGGGPGGMTAARTAALRGHHVTLWEKESFLGGNMVAAGAPDFKVDVKKFEEYLIRKTRESGVNIVMNKTATSEEILNAGFDAVILAAGSHSFIPKIKGIDGPNVLTANEAMCGAPQTGRVLVIGGGLVGMEAALQFDETAEQVTVVEVADAILKTLEENLNNTQALMNMIENSHINIVTSASVTEIGEGFALYEKDGETVRLECDTVVVASGYRPNDEMDEDLWDKFDFYRNIVPEKAPGKIVQVVHAGFHAGRLV